MNLKICTKVIDLKFEEYITTEVFLPRLKKSSVLVIYDSDGRYAEICMGLGSDDVSFIDASESSIESREAAALTFSTLGQLEADSKYMAIYVPKSPPVTDEEQQQDPFAAFAVCGGRFPDGDGDEYMSLCLRWKPDHATEIRQVFEDTPSPAFSVIENIGGGLGWPALRSALSAESARDIILALLVPNENQLEALKTQEGWDAEARNFLSTTLQLDLKTRGKTWTSISDELWRFILFSEFVFDLPTDPPGTLENVPRAPNTARPFVEDICDRLRADQTYCATYIERAETNEQELDLQNHCREIVDLGIRDTFPFEERTFMSRAVVALTEGEIDDAREIIARHAHSIWVANGESQAQWGLVEAALNLAESCEDCDRQLAENSRDQDSLIDYYLGSLQSVDRRQREFYQAVNDCLQLEPGIEDVIENIGLRYRALAEKTQLLFMRHLESSGWPPANRLANSDVFDNIVSPLLEQSGRRVAYILIDALRYEIGVALSQQLGDDVSVVTQAAFAQFPTETRTGMASLLPKAGTELRFLEKNDEFVPMLGEVTVSNVSQRMGVLKSIYGDRFSEMQLNAFVRSRKKLPQTIEFLVLRSVDIDSQLENSADTTLGSIHDTLKRLRAALHKLRELGFHNVVVATDHGFFLNLQSEVGDVCSKPNGNWVNMHERCLLGDGTEDPANVVISADKVGIKGDFNQFAAPRTMAPYRRGMLYFHGGASLHEAVVPVLSINLEDDKSEDLKASIILTYKNGASRVTTRLPVVDIELDVSDMFALENDFVVILEARDKKGNIIGEAKAGGAVDAATLTVTLKPRERLPITLKMDPDFEGKFSVVALDPTTLATHCSLDLQTDYIV
jgi:hypothetical protein